MIYSSTATEVFEDEVARIAIEADLSLLRLTWKVHPNSDQYRSGYRKAIFLALEFKLKYWLTDSRQVLYLHMADQHWMYAKMRPLLKGNKLAKLAIVLQPETLMMTDSKPMYETSTEPRSNAKKLYNMELFLDLDSAKSWLFENISDF